MVVASLIRCFYLYFIVSPVISKAPFSADLEHVKMLTLLPHAMTLWLLGSGGHYITAQKFIDMGAKRA